MAKGDNFCFKKMIFKLNNTKGVIDIQIKSNDITYKICGNKITVSLENLTTLFFPVCFFPPIFR
jgi:hypothetical protein